MNKAFTLIELLVVVLIIGILAAVALPQYRKAVEKTRAVEAQTNLAALVTAEKVYKIANGTATDKLDELDIQLSGSYNTSTKRLVSKYFSYYANVSPSGIGFEAVATRIDNGQNDLKYYIYFASDSKYHCVATHADARWFCEFFTRKKRETPNSNGYYYYVLD